MKQTAGNNSNHTITHYLDRWHNENDKGAFDQVIALTYDELRKIAGSRLQSNIRLGMGATELVNCAYETLLKKGELKLNDRKHFYAVASKAIRKLIINIIRHQTAQKRDMNQTVAIEQDPGDDIPLSSEELITLDHGLKKLAEVDEMAVRVVEMRYFAGYTLHETARLLGIPKIQVDRKWKLAKTWLKVYNSDKS